MFAIAITSNSYLMNFYGQKIGWSWFYSSVITIFVDFFMWDWFCTFMCKCCDCGCCKLIYRMFCYLKIAKMMSFDGWIVTKQEPGKKYLERIREVTVNEMLGLEENKIQRDEKGNLIIKNPIEERSRQEKERIQYEIDKKAQAEIDQMKEMNLSEIEEMKKEQGDEANSGLETLKAELVDANGNQDGELTDSKVKSIISKQKEEASLVKSQDLTITESKKSYPRM